jgi:hypothetical protein
VTPLALLAGLALAAPGPVETPREEEPVRETIDETTVGDLDGVRVPMANMTTGSYTRADGSEARGTICALVLPGGPVFVGLGSAVTLDGARWEVVAIEKSPGQFGSVTLERK